MKRINVILLVLLILFADQALKIWVKTRFNLHENRQMLGSGAQLYFVENMGMAYGWSFGGNWGKLALTVFRMVAVVFGTWYIGIIIAEKYHKSFIICAALIYAGAIGNLLDLHAVGNLCEKYGALFHSDTVQTMGHFVHNVQELPVHFLVGAGHKFHGPKGIGFLYAKSGTKFSPLMHGGAQERNQRGGTENVYGMVGIAKALSLAYQEMAAHEIHIKDLKTYFIQGLQDNFPGIEFNGLSADIEKSLYTVINVRFPQIQDGDMLLFKLDIEKISASGGSACSSGTSVGSHVLTALNPNAEGAAVRFSFSKNNTKAEIDRVLEVLRKIIS